MNSLKTKYDYEHIIIDNNSSDNTSRILKEIAKTNKNVKIIFNNRNFGQLRSAFHGIIQACGNAVIFMNSDFQDPIDLIPKYIKSWEKGHLITMGQKSSTNETLIMKYIRIFYHKILNIISKINMPVYTTGSGIYDEKVINFFRSVKDPYPYIRGLAAEIEEDIKLIKFDQPKRLYGKSKNNFFTLYDIAMLAITKHSTFPLRIMIFLGFIFSLISFVIATIYFIFKIIYWDSFEIGIGPIVFGMFGFFSITIMLIGLMGEYILLILSYSQNLPLVIEKERINF
jgi:glycosyltransferase involved in cell wall biosynthesis